MLGVTLMAAAALAPAANGRIAFTSFRDGPSRIYTMNADGSDQRAVTDGPDAQPDWAPDGGAIAFRRGTTSAYEVWVGDRAPGRDESPDWQPVAPGAPPPPPPGGAAASGCAPPSRGACGAP